MRKRMALNGLALLGLLASTNVLAETQPGFYAGVGVGTATIEDSELGFDADDTAFKVFGGYNFNRYFALELAYVDAGKPDETIDVFDADVQLEVGTTGLIASVIGRVPLGEAFSVYGKVGFASYDVDVKVRFDGDVIADESDGDEDVAYGIGAALNVGPSFELRAEYEAVDVSDGDFNVLSVSGLYKF